MPGVAGEPVVTMLVCFFILHARLRVHCAPGIPCALWFQKAGLAWQNSDASRRGNAKLRRMNANLRYFASSLRKRGPVSTGRVDCIQCRNIEQVLSESHRVVKPGGRIPKEIMRKHRHHAVMGF
jgi:hypothetical protein